MAQDQPIVFFDLDGTLIDVSSRHYLVYSTLINKFAGRALSKRHYWHEKRLGAKWPVILSKSGISELQTHAFLNDFIDLIEQPELLRIDPLFPDSLATLKLLAQSHELYLASLRRNPKALADQLHNLGIKHLFKTILVGHSESAGEDAKVELIRPFASANRDTIVGDTEADVRTGKSLGLKTIALTSGIRDRGLLSALAPDFIRSHIGEVPALLQS